MPGGRKNNSAHGPEQEFSLSVVLEDEAATAALAASIERIAGAGDIFALKGGLGAGKTTFARHFLRARGCVEDVPSPTFTLVQVYHFDNHREAAGQSKHRAPVWHFDLYRIDAPGQVYELGIEDAFNDGVSLIEWPERMAALLPPEALTLEFEFGGASGARAVHISGAGGWAGRLSHLANLRSDD